MYVLRISMCQMLCWTNQTWPCILEAYSIVENVNIIYLIITVIIAIQEKLRTPRSGASRNPDLSRWLLGSLSLHFWNGQRGGGARSRRLGQKLKMGWQLTNLRRSVPYCVDIHGTRQPGVLNLVKGQFKNFLPVVFLHQTSAYWKM